MWYGNQNGLSVDSFLLSWIIVLRLEFTAMTPAPVVTIVPAAAEWDAVLEYYGVKQVHLRPYEYFARNIEAKQATAQAIFLHSGCGKVPAAAATQYAIDTWHPSLVINIGTCGGLDSALKVGDLILAERTVIYDICERSGGQEEMIERFTTDLPDCTAMPACVKRGTLVTGDQDADPARIQCLRLQYGAIAADWESGAVAYVACKCNGIQCRILRVVSDMVTSGDIGNNQVFAERIEQYLPVLLEKLPDFM
jgi:adenosylhomocysteine nucleosidase